MVRIAAAIIADGSADGFGDGVQVAKQGLDALAGQIGLAFQRRVKVVGVGRVVLWVLWAVK